MNVILAQLLACSYAGDPAALDEPTRETGDTASPTPPLEEGWYSLSGALEVGDRQVLQGVIDVSLWAIDARGRPTLACTTTVNVDSPAPARQAEDEVQVYGMWTVDLAVDTCFGAPETIDLGLGPLPRAMWPAVESEGVSSRHARGLYLNDDGLVIFGFAGTPSQLDGRGAPTSLDPLPDGTYAIATSYLIEL